MATVKKKRTEVLPADIQSSHVQKINISWENKFNKVVTALAKKKKNKVKKWHLVAVDEAVTEGERDR